MNYSDGFSESSESDSHFASKNPSNPSKMGTVNDGKAWCKSRQKSGSDNIIKELKRMESALSASVQEVSQRVDHLEGTPPSPRKPKGRQQTCCSSDTLSSIG